MWPRRRPGSDGQSVKVTLDGEQFDYDGSKKPMSEALAIEKAWGRRYADWETELAAGSAEAFCVLAWLIWRRDGRDVDLKDILDGKKDFDLFELVRSVAAAGEAAEAEAAQADPTTSAGSADPAGTPTTRAGTSGRSRRSSG